MRVGTVAAVTVTSKRWLVDSRKLLGVAVWSPLWWGVGWWWVTIAATEHFWCRSRG